MLTGKLPYGAEVAKAKTKAAQSKLAYESILDANRAGYRDGNGTDKRIIPVWLDEAIKQAVHPNPSKRYEDISEFVYDLRHPNKAFIHKTRPPLIERNPVVFWKVVCLLLVFVIAVLLVR